MIIDSVMQERVTAALLLVVLVPGLPTQHPVPAPVRDAALLLDIHVHELTRLSELVTDEFRPPNPDTGRLIDVSE